MKEYSKLSKKERKAVLKKAAQEIQDICEFSGAEDLKETDGSENALSKWIKEAYKEIEPGDKFSEEATAVFVALELTKEVEAEEAEKVEESKEEKVEEAEDVNFNELKDEVNDCSKMKELKHLVKMYDTFEGLRDGISSYTSVAALKKYMLSILDGDLQVAKAKDKVTPKSVKDKVKAAKKDAKPKNVINRQEAVLQTIKQKCKKYLTLNEIAEFSNELYVKKNKDIKGVSKVQNMMNVVRYSVLALEEFEILKCEDAKYKLT